MPSARHNVNLQERDLALLKGLFESRLMTLAHAAAIHFGGSAEAAKKRVQKLKAAGYLAERPRRAYEPSILFLTARAFAFLSEGGHLAAYPKLAWANLEKRARVSPLTLAHELDVMSVKAAFMTAVAATPTLAVAEFSTWPLLYQFKAAPGAGKPDVLVKPDGYLRLHQTAPDGSVAEHAMFLEVDRSTETLETLAQRAASYRDYYRRGGLAARHGRPRSEFEQYPFRVLMVFKTAERRNNVAAKLLACNPPILTQTWLTTFAEVSAHPLAAIWVRPADYREATRGTPYGSAPQANGAYRRTEARETFVNASAKKSPLFGVGDTHHE